MLRNGSGIGYSLPTVKKDNFYLDGDSYTFVLLLQPDDRIDYHFTRRNDAYRSISSSKASWSGDFTYLNYYSGR